MFPGDFAVCFVAEIFDFGGRTVGSAGRLGRDDAVPGHVSFGGLQESFKARKNGAGG